MATINPPLFEFPNINFNSSFFTDTNGSLTQSQANKLYLQKTIADSATALETFSSIKTSSILPNGNSSCFTDSTGTLINDFGNGNYVANFGSGSYIANFGLGATNCRFGEGTTANFELGRYMPSTAVRMAFGGCTDILQLTDIALGTTTGNDTLSGSGKIAIGGQSMNVIINSDSTTIGRTSGGGTSTTMNGNVTFSSPIGLGSLATLSSQLGGSVSMISNGVTSLAATTTTNLYTFTLPIGLWVLYGGATSATVASASYILLSFTSTSATVNVNLQNQVMTSTTLTLANSIMCPIYNATSTTWYLVGRAGVITNISNLNCLAYRIG